MDRLVAVSVKIITDHNDDEEHFQVPYESPIAQPTIASTCQAVRSMADVVNARLSQIIDSSVTCVRGTSAADCSYSASHWTKRPMSPDSVLKDFDAWLCHASADASLIKQKQVVTYGNSDNYEYISCWLLPERSIVNRKCIIAHVHGGYWQRLEEYFNGNAIRSLQEDGFSFAKIHYPALSSVSVSEQVECVCKAFATLSRRCRETGITSVIAIGHSAGAQLVSVAVQRLAQPFIHCLLLLSGVYDLQPLIGTRIGQALGLSIDTCRRVSPLIALDEQEAAKPIAWPLTLLFVGVQESNVFQKNTLQMAAKLRNTCRDHKLADCIRCFFMPDEDHFSLVKSLERKTSILRQIIRALAQQDLNTFC